MSKLTFLQSDWPELYEIAREAEQTEYDASLAAREAELRAAA